ncbi:MAG: hypothetical protein OZSIB_1758 [Candidatus Ozemobacter sibiricus]|jgi:hypothetical protein|uniref:Membrane-bound metal-dependent hydrolase n=1 Tax=Candidatus Ozemobacter sibiricus TaxID=2268124 RepID=A0A367ZK44_9BACT|nr:MAG: hypothetical protein OZSIB_1758 [Candidatus Ozemobacter sibiricus]
MNIITHALLGWVPGQRLATHRRDALLLTGAAMAPDLDGLGVLASVADPARGLAWFSQYHHVLAHNLWAGLAISSTVGLLARDGWRTALWAFLFFHLHLLGDLAGARGPDGESWPIWYLWPVEGGPALTWSGQWEINAWPNLLLTVGLLFLFFRQARDFGWSPLWYLSARADAAFVATLRRRFPLSA